MTRKKKFQKYNHWKKKKKLRQTIHEIIIGAIAGTISTALIEFLKHLLNR